MKSLAFVSPIVELAIQDLRELQREQLLHGYRLAPKNLLNGRVPRARVVGLNGDPDALVGALLQLSLEALTIHALAEADPDRPVHQVLADAVRQLRRS